MDLPSSRLSGAESPSFDPLVEPGVRVVKAGGGSSTGRVATENSLGSPVSHALASGRDHAGRRAKHRAESPEVYPGPGRMTKRRLDVGSSFIPVSEDSDSSRVVESAQGQPLGSTMGADKGQGGGVRRSHRIERARSASEASDLSSAASATPVDSLEAGSRVESVTPRNCHSSQSSVSAPSEPCETATDNLGVDVVVSGQPRVIKAASSRAQGRVSKVSFAGLGPSSRLSLEAKLRRRALSAMSQEDSLAGHRSVLKGVGRRGELGGRSDSERSATSPVRKSETRRRKWTRKASPNDVHRSVKRAKRSLDDSSPVLSGRYSGAVRTEVSSRRTSSSRGHEPAVAEFVDHQPPADRERQGSSRRGNRDRRSSSPGLFVRQRSRSRRRRSPPEVIVVDSSLEDVVFEGGVVTDSGRRESPIVVSDDGSHVASSAAGRGRRRHRLRDRSGSDSEEDDESSSGESTSSEELRGRSLDNLGQARERRRKQGRLWSAEVSDGVAPLGAPPRRDRVWRHALAAPSC